MDQVMDHHAQAFRSTYGRLCVLAAQALNDQFYPQAVYLASIGKNKAKDPQLCALADQQKRLDKTIRAAHKAGLRTIDDLVPIARVVKVTVEQEWDCSIPLHADYPKTSG